MKPHERVGAALTVVLFALPLALFLLALLVR